MTTDDHLTSLACRLIGRVEDRASIPSYGSPEWDALPDQDPRRAAAVMIAAEAWRDHCSPAQVALDLLAEMARVDEEVARRVKEASWDVCGDGARWEALAASPTHAELQQRRANPMAGPLATARRRREAA